MLTGYVCELIYSTIFEYTWSLYYLAYVECDETSKKLQLDDLRDKVYISWKEYKRKGYSRMWSSTNAADKKEKSI